jgi:hypothetical protein
MPFSWNNKIICKEIKDAFTLFLELSEKNNSAEI